MPGRSRGRTTAPTSRLEAATPKTVEVCVSLDGQDVVAGRLHSHTGRGAESATFSYDPAYLGDRRSFALEPALPLVAGAQQTPVGIAMFRSFADTAPDLWGRRLIQRTERARAERARTAAHTLTELTFLLGVRDDLRQGALRFRVPETGEFLADDVTGVPAVTQLPALLGLATRVEGDDAAWEDLRAMLRAGSSLGGARPKAHVISPGGRVAIAKFPSAHSDTWNVMAWEKTALDLAEQAGVHVPVSRLLTVAGRSVLVVDRFDRTAGNRLGYVSALTMLEARDGTSAPTARSPR